MTLIILRAISRSGKTLSQLVDEIRRSFESGEFNYKTDRATDILVALKDHYADADISDLDGIALEYPEWRCNIRTSNTEPLMRLNVEAKTEELMKEKLAELQALILEHGAELHLGH